MKFPFNRPPGWHWALGLAVAAALLLYWMGIGPALATSMEKPMPEFRNQSADYWINSRPLKTADLKGKVVLIEIWTSI